MSDAERDIDWTLTTWEGARRAQLRWALKLSLRERLEAAEGLADVTRRFEEMRARGEFVSACDAVNSQAAPGAREPSPPYNDE